MWLFHFTKFKVGICFEYNRVYSWASHLILYSKWTCAFRTNHKSLSYINGTFFLDIAQVPHVMFAFFSTDSKQSLLLKLVTVFGVSFTIIVFYNLENSIIAGIFNCCVELCHFLCYSGNIVASIVDIGLVFKLYLRFTIKKKQLKS